VKAPGQHFTMDENIQNNDYQIIQERVKQRPLNKKKLMRRMIITASMAVIFGVLACFTFLVLQPVFSNLLNPGTEPAAIEIPEDTEDEILPSDMVLEDEEELPPPQVTVIERTTTIDPMTIYENQYDKMYSVAQDMKKSVVNVTSLNQDVDWFDNEYINKNSTSGLYVANNGIQMMILAHTKIIENAQTIQVTFYDGTTATGEIRESDDNTGLSIVAVNMSDLKPSTISGIKTASLANSRASNLMASPVIAMGRIFGGTSVSVGYGIITAKGEYVNLTDQRYEIIRTNIYGSETATGIIANLNGEIVGIINQEYSNEECPNIINAVGISDIKKTIERMSNAKKRVVLGVIGTDVSDEISEANGVPKGAYVTSIVIDSPAMRAGIQSGDVIVDISGNPIEKFSEIMEVLNEKTPDTTIKVTLMRQNGEEYTELELDVTLEEM